jgi:hypothetical protein
MTKSVKLRALLVAMAVGGAAGAPAALADDACPNAALRTGPSAELPDCRAYELVTPDLNHAALGSQPAGQVTPDGDTMVYQTIDAPDRANSASVFNLVRAKRDATTGWSGVSLSPPLPLTTSSFQSFLTGGLSTDLSSTFEVSDQPLSGPSVPNGQNLFIGRPDGSYQLLTLVGTPISFLDVYSMGSLVGGTPDFSHVYMAPTVAQLPSDPLGGTNAYSWSEEDGLLLLGILPDDTPAPGGASFAGVSDDGRYVAFNAEGELYLRIDEAQTIRVGATQRTVNPDPNPASMPVVVGVTSSGSKILFTSQSELTNDANTGESGGIANDAGRDLYSFDTATKALTDLTVDTNPADAATGANVLLNGNGSQFVRSTSDGSYIYFTARGDLAEGATSGHRSLYVWHEGHIDFVAKADGINDESRGIAFHMTPDGRHVTFASSQSLTGFDNTDPVTGLPHSEVFEATIGSGLVCVSCRTNGTRPTGDSTVPIYTGMGPSAGNERVISEDGGRVFFHSFDAVVPQASSGFQQVFEYSGGKIAAISPVDGLSSSVFLDASPSGDDVFFVTYIELVPNPNGGDQTVYDARIDGGFPVSSREECSGVACQTPATPAPELQSAGSVTFVDGHSGISAGSGLISKVSVSKLKTITGTVGLLDVTVPGRGRLTISGVGLRTKRLSVSKANAVKARLALTGGAVKGLRKKGSFKTRVNVEFSDSGGHASTATCLLTFRVGSARRGR